MSISAAALPSERIAAWTQRALTALVLLFLIAPILIIVPLSFNDSSYFSYPMSGLTLKWYSAIFKDPQWRGAIANSFIIGLASTGIATVLGTLAAIGLSRPAFPWRGLIVPILISPMIIPVVVVAVSLYLVFAPLGLVNTHIGIILAHAALGAPFVVITVTARLTAYDHNLSRAAASLGAAPLEAFRRVMLPLILPGVAAGGVFAFATSFDEVVVILFIGGADQRTIPRQMWAGIRDQINPGILAMAGLLTIFAILLMLTLNALQGRTAAERNQSAS
jgi:putative spermidine/putrescine transport system permease protein